MFAGVLVEDEDSRGYSFVLCGGQLSTVGRLGQEGTHGHGQGRYPVVCWCGVPSQALVEF